MKHVLFTASMLAVAVGYLVMALRMPQGTAAYPGPGFFPMMVGVFMVLTTGGACALALLRMRRERATEKGTESGSAQEETLAPIPIIQLLGLLGLFVFVLPYTGFMLAIPPFILVAMRIFGHRRWGVALLFTALAVAAAYLVFVQWLAVPLPRGILDDYL